MKKNDTNELTVFIFYADVENKKLYVPKMVIDNLHNLNSIEARLYFQRRQRYPDFEIVVSK